MIDNLETSPTKRRQTHMPDERESAIFTQFKLIKIQNRR